MRSEGTYVENEPHGLNMAYYDPPINDIVKSELSYDHGKLTGTGRLLDHENRVVYYVKNDGGEVSFEMGEKYKRLEIQEKIRQASLLAIIAGAASMALDNGGDDPCRCRVCRGTGTDYAGFSNNEISCSNCTGDGNTCN